MSSCPTEKSSNSATPRDADESTAQSEDSSIVYWTKQGYRLPSESYLSQPELKSQFKPQSSDVPGIVIALTVIGTWVAVFIHALFQVKLYPVLMGYPRHDKVYSSPIHVIAVFLLLEFLYTGLFITAHDAMHGTIALRHRRLNDALGQVCLMLFAWFDYKKVHKKHWEHHSNTGKVGVDPDFHRGDPNVFKWYASFMMEYLSLWQVTRIAWWSVAITALGCPFENLLLYMAAAPLSSAFRLFYFGTYVPHHPDPGPLAQSEEMSWPRARTTHASRLQSFFTCYHFDMHWEHHRWPYAAWWELPYCRQLSNRGSRLKGA